MRRTEEGEESCQHLVSETLPFILKSAILNITHLKVLLSLNAILDLEMVNLIFGAGGIGEGRISHTWTTPEQTEELLKSLDELGLKQLDSAASYPPGSPWVTETLLGQAKAAGKGFMIDSKIMPYSLALGFREPKAKSGAESLSEANIDASFKKTFELMGIEKVNIMYAHCSDPETPAEESARAFNKHLQAGHCEKVYHNLLIELE
jgi:aflatoxin B1 aldehyde reductase